jgi:hypothetical protein
MSPGPERDAMIRSVVAVGLCAMAGSACLAGPVAEFAPEKAEGVDIVTVGDGQWEYKIIGGRKAVSLKTSAGPTNWYMYFKLDPEIRSKIGPEVWIAVDFFDASIGVVGIQSNGESNPYAGAPGFLLLETKKWQRALVHLANARLAGLQNEGADFRFIFKGPLAVSRLEVYSSKPNLAIPTDKERAMKSMSQTPKPKGMFYTFGNDADESNAPLYRALGVTSIESYVTWETCEREAEGKWDWSHWDKQVKILKDNDLKWVPFIILGPAYSTPNWFRASADHVPCRCLEHEIDSKIESRWNPNLPKWIDRFLGEFAKRYGKTGVIESVLLGIQGDYGEAIYSVSGGGWTFNIPGEYHNHPGYWCGDPYALASFHKYVSAKYGSADAVNKAWGTSFPSLDKVDYPGRKDSLAAFEAELTSSAANAQVRRRWLDFIDWYRGEMTRWADWWIATTRKYFPTTPIYLCTGGDAEPRHGSNFAEQCRVAAKHNAGVRITNEGSDYASNFVITRWVASAGKHYGAYFGFEPAGGEDEVGIVARIYNATASGANQLHDYNPNVVSSESRINAQRTHIKWLFHVPSPVVPVALWYPNVALTLSWGGFFGQARMLRDLVDYDYVDETMLRSGALAKHKLLVIVHGAIMEKNDAKLIAEWIKAGGRAIVMGVDRFESVEGTSEPEAMLFGQTPRGRSLGNGEIARVANEDELAARLAKDMRELGLAVYDLRKDGIFGTQIDDGRLLFLNTGSGAAKVRVEYQAKIIEPRIDGGTISEVAIK